MELLKEILIRSLEKETMIVVLPNLEINPAEIVETQCYKSLKKIKTIIENDSLSDFECIEEIVHVFEGIGSNGGCRHDFG